MLKCTDYPEQKRYLLGKQYEAEKKAAKIFRGKLHFAGKDFLLDAGREVVCDVDASCIVAGTKNGSTADTVFLCDPVAGFLPGVVDSS